MKDNKPRKKLRDLSKNNQTYINPAIGKRISDLQENIKNSIPDISSNLVSSATPSTSPIVSSDSSSFNSSPKREIEMTASEEDRVKKAFHFFEYNSFNQSELLEIFEDWQSDRTKSIKKFLLSILTVLSLTAVAGINILEVELFNISVADNYEYWFLSILLMLIVGLFCYYEINLFRDKKVNDSKLEAFINTLHGSDHYLEEIDNILNLKNVTIEQLIEDFQDSFIVAQQNSSPLVGYRTMKFFKNKLKKPFSTDLKIFRFEISALYFIGLLSGLSIVRSLIWVDRPDANLDLFYILGTVIILSTIAILQIRFDN